MPSYLYAEKSNENPPDDKDEEPLSRRFVSYERTSLQNFPAHFISSERTVSKSRSNQVKIPKTPDHSFRNQFFHGTKEKEWQSWHWQMQHRIRTLSQLSRILKLSSEEKNALETAGVSLPLGITPYYASLLAVDDANQPLRKTVVPTLHELFKMTCESDDPLAEDQQTPVCGLVHRYPDRVLLLVTDFCSTYCRYCTRSRMVGHGRIYPNRSRLQMAVEYIKNTPAVRDVLLSGGDPLTLSDDRIEWLLQQLRPIPHIDIIRIGTKVPAVLPQRITKKLVRILRKYHPLWMSLHFIHSDECTPEAYRACAMLADSGIPLGSQTVLLKGINDDVDTMKSLMHHLLKMRVRPYYLYQCDPITGSSHFRTPVEKGLEIIRGLRGFTSGYAIPTYVIDAPGGGGKIPLMPNYSEKRKKNGLVIKNYESKQFIYPDSPNYIHN